MRAGKGAMRRPWLVLLVLVAGCACPGPIAPEHYTQDRYQGRWPGRCEVVECMGEARDWCLGYHPDQPTLCAGKE